VAKSAFDFGELFTYGHYARENVPAMPTDLGLGLIEILLISYCAGAHLVCILDHDW
jgi:hypothetical protein